MKSQQLWTLAFALLVTACTPLPRREGPPSGAPPRFARSATLVEPYGERPADVWISPTQIAFLQGYELVVNLANRKLEYRREGTSEEWRASPLSLRRPHAVALGANGHIYLADTSVDRILRFKDPTRAAADEVTAIAGKPLRKPHDIVADPRSGMLYVVDGARRLYRLRDFGVEESYLQLTKEESGYARALSVVDGVVYLVSSSRGEVVRIDDFDRRELTVFSSPHKREVAPGGTWEDSGLILNDVEYFDGYWYGSNFYHRRFARQGDPDRYRLIRWRRWSDFERGRWQDLSRDMPQGVIPYYFTVHRDQLFVAGLSQLRHEPGGIFRVAVRGRR